MSSPKKIAFIRKGLFSHTNASVIAQLEKNFPDYQIDDIDVASMFLGRTDLTSRVHGLLHYPGKVLRREAKLIDVSWRTPHIFRAIQKRVRAQLAKSDYAFTFQTQSLFDVSMPGVPHFLYTDHTHLENKRYPGFDHKNLCSPEWIECEREVYRNTTLNFTWSSNISRSMHVDYGSPEHKNVKACSGANVQASKDEAFNPERYQNKRILFVGIEWERKGGPTMIEAFRKVLKKHPTAELVIVGCSPNLDVPNCTATGKIPLAEVKQHFQDASLFALPTTLEPFGIAYLEAMAHKLPNIGSNIGAIPDFIQPNENGYLVEPGNADQLADAIIKLLDSPERCAAFGEAGHKLFWDNYTWDHVGERFKEHITPHLQ